MDAAVDVSGSLAVSLWNRDAHSLVRFGGGIRLEQSACLQSESEGSSVGREQSSCVHLVARFEGHIDFTTAVDAASSPPRVCAMMVLTCISFLLILRISATFLHIYSKVCNYS